MAAFLARLRAARAKRPAVMLRRLAAAVALTLRTVIAPAAMVGRMVAAIRSRPRMASASQTKPASSPAELFAELDDLAATLRSAMPATAESLGTLKNVLSKGDAEAAATETADSIQWSSVDLFRAFDPEILGSAAGRLKANALGSWVSVADSSRAVLIFVPVTLTWIGIGKATAVFATCSAGAGQFLTLWQQGFPKAYGCDSSRGTTFLLPLNSLEEVVFADTIVLAAIMVLTLIAQRASAFLDGTRVRASIAFADRLRAALATCQRRLHPAAEKDISALVLEATRSLEGVATSFSAQTDVMIKNLQESSAATERSLVVLEHSYDRVAATTVAATEGLKSVVDRVAATADRLVETSIGVREELAAGTAALRDSVTNSSSRLDELGRQLSETMSATASQLTSTTRAVREDLAAGASALRDTVRTSSDQLREFGGELRTVGDGLQRMDGRFSDLARLGFEAEAKNESARENIARMANAMDTLPELDKSIQGLYASEKKVFAPIPAWQTYGVVLVVQTVLVLILVLRVGETNAAFRATEVTPPGPSIPTQIQLPVPPIPQQSAPAEVSPTARESTLDVERGPR